MCGRIGQVRNDGVTEAGALPSGSFAVSLDIIAIHVGGTAYYDRVSWRLMDGKGMVSSGGSGRDAGGADLGELWKGSRAGYEE